MLETECLHEGEHSLVWQDMFKSTLNGKVLQQTRILPLKMVNGGEL